MSEALLSAVRDQLLALPSEQVEAPEIPMAVVLQEANDLLTLVSEDSVWNRLATVGTKESDRDALRQAIGAARAAQSSWTVSRDRRKSDAQQARELRGEKLRLDLVAAGRWNLRADRVAQGALDAIVEGEGVADLVQDLNDLAALFEQKRAAFESDKSLDLGARIEEARSLAAELAAGTSSERLDTEQAKAVDLRNRAYSLLDQLVSRLREAGRYAFREQEEVRRRFASRYLKRKGQRAKAAAAARNDAPAAEEAN